MKLLSLTKAFTLVAISLLLVSCGGSNVNIPGTSITVVATLDESSPIIAANQIPITDLAGTETPTHPTTFDDLSNIATFAVTARLFDLNDQVQTIQIYFFHIAQYEFLVRSYVVANAVTTSGSQLPQLTEDASGINEFVMTFDPSSGGRTNDPISPYPDIELMIPWNDNPVEQEANLYFQDIVANTSPSEVSSIKAR